MTTITERPEKTAEPTRQVPVFSPRFDIVETDAQLTLYGDMPGVAKDCLDVRYENEQLVIHGKVPSRNDGERFIREEYGVGDFHRTFSVGEAIDTARISAELRNGVLTIQLPKTEALQPRRIEVKAV
jgi:HSP20 family molecular chaperone IbpA